MEILQNLLLTLFHITSFTINSFYFSYCSCPVQRSKNQIWGCLLEILSWSDVFLTSYLIFLYLSDVFWRSGEDGRLLPLWQEILVKNDPTILTWREVNIILWQSVTVFDSLWQSVKQNNPFDLFSHYILCPTGFFGNTLHNTTLQVLKNLSFNVFVRSKTVGGLARTSCCPTASSPTMWRTANRLWISLAAWRVKTTYLNINCYIRSNFPFLEKTKIFDSEASTSSLLGALAQRRTDSAKIGLSCSLSSQLWIHVMQ